LRLGGDEFALVVPADERATQFLKRIVVEVEKSRGEHVGAGSNELGSYVVERDTMRTIRNDYRREVELHHGQFTAHGFFEYMRDSFVPRGPDPLLSRSGFDEYLQSRGIHRMLAVLRVNPAQEDLAAALEAGYLQKYIAGVLITGMTAPAGRFSMSSVEIGATPRWEDYHLAEGVASKRIQATKDKVFTVDIEPALSVNSNFVVKLHESEACRAFVEREEAYARLRSTLDRGGDDSESRAADLYKLVMLAVSDPNLPGVMRGDLIREIPAEVVLGRRHEGPIYALVLNVRSFGVVNNSKSYTEADRMLADVVSVAAADFPPLAVVRQGGGRIVLIGTQPFEIDDVARIRGVMEARVKEHLREDPAAYQRMLVEYGERYALNSRWRSGEFTLPPLDFGTCGVSIAMVKTEPTAPLDLGNM
jgi:GGDEF domain-containing protein